MREQIDEIEVEKARRELKTALNRWPSLRGGPGDCDDWMDILKGEGMADNNQGIQIGARLDAQMIEGIDRFAKELTAIIRKTAPGVRPVARSEAVRMLLTRALHSEGILVEGPPIEQEGRFREARADAIRADLLAGNYTNQRELAKRHKVAGSTISRIKSKMQLEGRL